MLSSVSDFFSTPRVQLLATAVVSGATVASLILGYQALDREERLSELKQSIPSLSDDQSKTKKVSYSKNSNRIGMRTNTWGSSTALAVQKASRIRRMPETELLRKGPKLVILTKS